MRKSMFLFLFLCLILALPVQPQAKEKSKEKKPHALIADYSDSGDAKRVKGCLEDAGFKVTISSSQDKIDPEKFDALVIPGGHNITPSVYGAKRDSHTYGTDLNKDKMQIKAIKKFKKKKKPILGVCRGCQVLNVAFGGTIDQHIPGWHKGDRKMKIHKSAFVYDIFGESETTYHSHHQCVKKLGDNLVAVMWDDKDGRIEGIQHKTLPVYGIQWHPDSHMGKKGIRVFRVFRKICEKYMKEDTPRVGTAKTTKKATTKEVATTKSSIPLNGYEVVSKTKCSVKAGKEGKMRFILKGVPNTKGTTWYYWKDDDMVPTIEAYANYAEVPVPKVTGRTSVYAIRKEAHGNCYVYKFKIFCE